MPPKASPSKRGHKRKRSTPQQAYTGLGIPVAAMEDEERRRVNMGRWGVEVNLDGTESVETALGTALEAQLAISQPMQKGKSSASTSTDASVSESSTNAAPMSPSKVMEVGPVMFKIPPPSVRTDNDTPEGVKTPPRTYAVPAAFSGPPSFVIARTPKTPEWLVPFTKDNE